MNRILAFLAALFLAPAGISSICSAAPRDQVHFTIEPGQRGDLVHATFRTERDGRNENSWSTGFAPADLVGLDLVSLRAPGTRALHFTLSREAGRLDCSGEGGNERARGECSFMPDPAFTAMLQQRGIGRPTAEQAFALMSVNARRELIDALAAAHYPKPSINDLIPVAALGVNGRYIGDLAGAGYRPNDLDALVQFKALNITPEFIAGFERIGYRHLPVDELVQLKALGITPQFVQQVSAMDGGRASIDRIVEAKALGFRP